ncbi:unnamed protein product [Rotaria sp. Silwood1]|nr:unnamed protein product [Rotaria sp. Silwood1]
MSTETIPHQLDKFSETSAVVGIGKTREEYLKLFSRACISPENDRPYTNPMSGFYDAINTSTSLILLNQRFKYSHLREQTLFEELSNSAGNEFDYESKSHMKPRRSVSVNCRSPSGIFRQDKCHQELQPDSSFAESVYQYYHDAVENSKQSEFNLQQCQIKESINQPLKSTGIRRKLPLTKGQQLSLLEKYHIYDIKDTKVRRSHSYSQTLSDRLKAGRKLFFVR